MVPEIVVAMLAIIKIGGVFLPLFSGFGAAAVVSRLNDAEAKAYDADAELFSFDGCLLPVRDQIGKESGTARR